MKKLKTIIGSMASKFAALALALTCVGNVWGVAQTIAKIDDTEYRSLQDAVNRVTNGQTIRLVANCDETALVARIVSFTLVVDEGVTFNGSIAQGSQETKIVTAEGESGGTVYTMTQPRTSFSNNTAGDTALEAYIKKAWEKEQSGVFIAGHKVAKSGAYDGDGYLDANGKISVDLEKHAITLNNATITVSSSAISTYTKSFPGTSWPNLAGVIHNEIPYEGVVCLSDVKYRTQGSGAGRTNSDGRYHQPLGYNMGGGMATAGIAILDGNAWTVTLIGENSINVTAAFSYPSGSSYATAGDAYGIYAKGNLTVVKGNGESVGNLVADITNNGTGNYQMATYYPGNSAVCSMGNLTISEGATISATLDGTMTATVSGTEYTTQNFAKYGAIYAATNVTINGATVAATNKLVSSAAGYGQGVSAIGSQYGNITIDGGSVDAVCLGQIQVQDYSTGEMVTAYRGQGISTYGEYGAYTTVEIRGGADVNVEAGISGIAGNGGVSISGQETAVDVDVVGDGIGIAASQGSYQISQASVTVNATEAVAENYQTGNSISTGDYSSSVPANAVAANTYQYYQNGMYHLTDTIPTGWVAYYDGTFYMDAGSSAEAIALCGEGKSVYINEDSSAAKTGIGEGRNFTVYVLEGKSYTGAVTSERLVSNLTTGDATEFDGKTYVPNTFTMSVDPEHSVAKIVKADGTTTYYASMATSYSSPRYTGAANSLKVGDTLVILEDVALTSSLSKSFDWTLDLNGCKLTAANNYYVQLSSANRTLTIKDSSAAQTGVIHQTYVPSNNNSAGSGVRCSNGTIVIESGRFTGGNTPVVATGSGVIEIRGGYFDGELYVQKSSPGTYVCYGGKYTVDPTRHVAEGYAAAKTVVNETDLWIVGRLDMTTSVNATSDISAEYVISASIYDADDNLIAKLAEDQTIAVSIDETKDVTDSTLAKFDVEKVVTAALLNAEDSSKVSAIAISVQSALTNTVTSTVNGNANYIPYFDVKPVAVVTADGVTSEFTIADSALAEGAVFEFDLDVTDVPTVEVGVPCTVTHISSYHGSMTTPTVVSAGVGDTKVVHATATYFSTWRVNFIQAADGAVAVGFMGSGSSLGSFNTIADAVTRVRSYGGIGTVMLVDDVTLDASVSIPKPTGGGMVIDLNGHTITLADGVENAFVISGEGTKLTIKNGTAPVGISGYPENYAVVATTVDGATTYTAAPAVAQVEIAGVVTKYADLHAALEAGKAAGSVVTLLADVDLNDDDWTPVGTSSDPFYGSFDGNGHTIKNLWVSSEDGNAGLFGWIGKINSLGGTFKNLTLENVSNYCDQNSAANVGTLAGFANTAMISNITVKTATVVGRTEVAGLTGNAYTSKILDCHLEDITVTCGYGRTGGIAGQGYCTISGCSVTGLNLTGAWAAGGIIGLCNACAITDNYVQGALRADKNYGDPYKIGGIVGTYNETAKQTISGNYCNATVFNYQHSTIDYFPIVGMLNTPTPPAESIEALAENSWSREIFDTDNVGMANYDEGIPRDNNLVAIMDDLQYVEAGTVTFVSASGLTAETAAAAINAEGNYRAIANADGTMTVIAYVAQIVTDAGATTNKYESLETAYSAATSGDVIEMLADYRLSVALTFNKSVTLTGAVDEDGKPKYTIYGNPTTHLPGGMPQLFINSPSSPVDLTFQNLNFSEFGNERSAAAGYGFIYISKNSNADTHLMISNVTMTAFNCDAITAIRGNVEVVDSVIDGAEAPGDLCYGIRIGNHDVALNPTVSVIRTVIRNIANYEGDEWAGQAIVASASARVTISDCVMTNVVNGVTTIGRNANADAATANVTLENTVINARDWAFDISKSAYDNETVTPALVTVTSGMYSGAIGIGNSVAEKATISISGGNFSQYIVEDFCASGYLCTTAPVANGYYQVVPAATVTFSKGEEADVSDFECASLAYPSGNPAETALPQPTYTSTVKAFAGWKVNGEGDAVFALPAGTAGDQTLVAAWTGARVLTIAAEEGKDTQIKVTDEWLEANGLADADDAAVKAALEAPVGGVPRWESYVLGQSIGAAVSSGAEQGATTLMPVTSTIDVPAVDTGFDVQYRLDTVDASGNVVAQGTAQATPDLALELSGVESSAYYRLAAVVTAKDGSGASVSVQATNTIGVLAVESSAKTTAIAVPWESLDGGEISVSNLVRTANLTPGDELKAYYPDGKNYKAWVLDENKTWQPATVVGGSSETAADAYPIPRGAGVWLTRADPSQPIYLVGGASASGDVKTSLEAASGGNPSWNLVGNPSVEPVSVAALLDGKSGDKIIVPTAGAPKNYVYEADKGGWGYWTTETIVLKNGRKVAKSVFKTDDANIPAGTGFWYLNSSEEAGAEIDW